MSERTLTVHSIDGVSSVERQYTRAPATSSFYERTGKRIFDAVAAGLGLALLLPLLGIVAMAIKLSSRGPILFRQIRVGRNGRSFTILKFRSMGRRLAGADSGITVAGDDRITPVGRILRKYKLDELPQLWTVLRGDMSLVGPRPELPQYVSLYSLDQRRVLSVRPGITDPASLAYRDEERVLAAQDAPQRFYIRLILPDKLRRNLQYIDHISFRNDLQLIFQTFFAILKPASDRR